jgi:uncharacterized protein (DUF58 family)
MKSENQYNSKFSQILSVADLEWIARQLSAGFIHGKHHSNRLHTDLEFQQYRPYVQGDDVRAIDWKMYAKSGKYFIRQSPMETDHHFHLLLDNSESMSYQEDGVSKLTIGKILIAAITRIIACQGDYFEWTSHSSLFPRGSGLRVWNRNVQALFELEASKIRNLNFIPSVKSKVIIWITDLYYTRDEISRYLSTLKLPATEVILFHLVGKQEKNLDFSSGVTFVDLETKERLELNSDLYRKRYTEKLSSHFHYVQSDCLRKGIWYQEVGLRDNLRELLSLFIYKYNYLVAV